LPREEGIEEDMAGKKKEKPTVRGGQLLARGDTIRVYDGGALIQCRVLSCIAAEQGLCHASLEILEGDKRGERISTTLRAADNSREEALEEPAE
jgi:hypothetical protein